MSYRKADGAPSSGFGDPSPSSSSSSADHLDPSTRDRDWIDVLSPNEPGLPIFTATRHSNGHSSMANPVQVVDSSAARRRGGGGLVEGQANLGHAHDPDSYDGGKGDKYSASQDGAWPASGIGMESRVAPTPGELVQPSGKREFSANQGQTHNKWDRLIPERRQPQSWVRSRSRSSPTRQKSKAARA